MNISLRKKIIFLVLSLLFIVTLAASVISTMEIQRYYKNRIVDQMIVQLDEVEYLLGTQVLGFHDSTRYNELARYADHSRHRLTLIDSTGIVLFDSHVTMDSLHFLENHLNRPEIQMALKSDIGQNQRKSATLNHTMFYAAKLYKNGGKQSAIRFIRLALPIEEIEAVLNTVRWKIMLGGGIALILIAVVSYLIASRLTYPIHQLSTVAEKIKAGNYDERFDVSGSDEIGELADLLNDMLDKLKYDLIRMKKLEEMRSQFLGNVSHELRTPIFSVQGYLETLMENPGAEQKKQQKFIKKAYRQAVRLNNLLTDLIDISRIESGEMKMTFNPFDVHDWLHKMVMDLKETAAEQSVFIKLANEKNEHVKVLGDRERLNQVILNLATNAIKYNKINGQVLLGYTVLRNKVEIYVSDTGRGIEKEHLTRIFERFYRVDKERSREVGGTGLGLAIVKHIIEAHDSTVYVESEIGVGSSFSFRLRKV
ncbi:HAMP domain-containing histidine kinase [candidate division KSB1 bacterium]|nr:HAMP domain-containing protein [candidate division KSB1 bacterium]RQW03251.1 MAG: HAMP domain-containing histidine kinase [candidate division KSB1 bacterium]